MGKRDIRFEYDADADAAYLTLGRGRVVESEEVKSGIIVDLAANERVLGVEILRFTKRFSSKIQSRSAARLTRRTAR